MLCLLFIQTNGQITITRNDMPDAGDVLLYRYAANTAGVDHTLTGNNYNWNFSGLQSLALDYDVFVDVWDTPLAYQAVFGIPIHNPTASIARDMGGITTLPGPGYEDVYEFYKETNTNFNYVGFAVRVNMIPIPVKFNTPEVVYEFPLTAGSSFSSISNRAFTVEDYGYISVDRTRTSEVDGWGTLVTPYGTFQTLRVKSIVHSKDSVFIQSTGTGYVVNRVETEYKWLANGYHRPVLRIVERTEGPDFLPLRIEYLSDVNEPFTVDAGDDQYITYGEPATLTAQAYGGVPPYFYVWSNAQTGNTITVSPAQTTTYIVNATDFNLYNAQDQVTVFVDYACNNAHISNFPTGENVCQNTSYSIDFSGVIIENAVEVQWLIIPPEAGEIFNDEFNLNSSYTGNVTITLKAIAEEPCLDDEVSLWFTVYPTPPISITPDGPVFFCDGGSVALTATPGISYLWSTGETAQSIEVNVTGIFMVHVTDGFGCVGYDQIAVIVYDLPQSVIEGELEICAGEETTLSVPAGSSWEWSNGETTQSITVSEPGVYWVTMTDENGCQVTLEVTVTLIEPIIPFCPDDIFGIHVSDPPFLLTGATPEGGVYYGDGVLGTYEFNPALAGVGSHLITYLIYDDCGPQTCSFVIHVEDEPPVCFDAVIENFPAFLDDICFGEELSIDFSGVIVQNAVTVEWTIDPAEAGEIEDEIFVLNPAYVGLVYIHLIATAAPPCFDAMSGLSFAVHPLPDISIYGDYQVCEGETTELTATQGSSYLWNTGEISQIIIVSEAGIYSVEVIDENGCAGAAEVEVSYFPVTVPVCPENLTVLISDEPFTLTGGVPEGGSYSGAGVEENSVFNPALAGVGVHLIAYQIEDLCGLQFCTFEIVVEEEPQTCLDAIIENFPAFAVNACTGEDYSIDFSNVNIENAIAVNWLILPAEAGSIIDEVFYLDQEYTGPVAITLTAIAEAPCENAQEGLAFMVFENPEVSIEGTIEFCQNDFSVLTATDGFSYLWSTDETTQSIIVVESGLYWVEATDLNGCSAIAQVDVTVVSLPEVSCPADFQVYIDDPVVSLSMATPVGGIYSGSGVYADGAGYSFDPAIGLGYHEITYCYGDTSTGCENCCTFTILVKSNMGDEQTICIPAGWSIVSSYLQPYNDDFTNIFSALVADEKVVIVLGENGFYWPSQNINTLSGWDVYTGYKLKLSEAGCLEIFGEAPENKTIIAKKGHGFLPVLCDQPILASSIFDQFGNNLVYAFDLHSHKIYWPDGGIFTLEYLVPGVGYLLRMKQDDVATFNCAKAGSTEFIKQDQLSFCDAPWSVSKSEKTHFISISDLALKTLEFGDYVGVFTTNGECAGLTKYSEQGNLLLVANGIDFTTESDTGLNEGEQMTFRIYRPSANAEIRIYVAFDNSMPDHALFADQGQSLITEIQIAPASIADNTLESICLYPNPGNGVFHLTFPETDQVINIQISNLTGQVIFNKRFEELSTNQIIDLGSLNPGLYFVKITFGNQFILRRIIIQ